MTSKASQAQHAAGVALAKAVVITTLGLVVGWVAARFAVWLFY